MNQLIKRSAICCLAMLWCCCIHAQPNITRVEYYIDGDPGYGKAINVNITAGKNLSNIVINLNPNNLSTGVHVLGIRARDANGTWSLDNRWLFAKPYPLDTVPAQPASTLKQVEYYIDTDLGYGKGFPLAINNVINLNNFSLPVNVSKFDTGYHKLFIRSKNANGAWSLDNVFLFRINTAIKTASIVVNSVAKKALCAKDSFALSYQATGAYNAGNVFNVQLSDATGSFASPTVIGSFTGTKSNIVNCVLPASVTDGIKYRVRMVSTNPVVEGITGADTLSIHNLPAKPTITPAGPLTFCADSSAKLTASSGYAGYLWSSGQTTKIITVKTTGNYSVTGSNSFGCTATSGPVSITVNPLPAKPAITTSDPTNNLCPGKNDTLTSSTATSYLWSTGATTKSIVVSAKGSYSLKVFNAKGCSNKSDTVFVTVQSCPKPKGLKISSTTATTAKVKWNASACGAAYQLQYRPVGSVTWTTVTTSSLTFTIKNLTASTEHEWQLATTCQTGPQIISGFTTGANFTTAVSLNAIVSSSDLKTSSGNWDAVIAPNPAVSAAKLVITGNTKPVTITITDMAGKILWKKDNVIDRNIKLPLQNLTNGTYLVTVIEAVNKKTLKLLKQ